MNIPDELLVEQNAAIATGPHGQHEWLTTKEAAEYLRIPAGTLRNWTSSGRVPYRKFGRLNRYKRSELRDLLDRNRRGGSYDN